MQIAPIRPNNIKENQNSDNINFGCLRRRKKRPFRPYNTFEGNRFAVYHSYEDYLEGKAPKWVKGYNRYTGETEAKYKRNRPFWNGSQYVDIEYLVIMGSVPILALLSIISFTVAFPFLLMNAQNKKYKTVIEAPYITPQSEKSTEISMAEAKSIKELQKIVHKLDFSACTTDSPEELIDYIQQQIKEAQGKYSAEGTLVTKDEINKIKYNFKNKKKELRGKAVDGYKSFETTKLGAPISEAIKFQNIKNYSKNLLANAKLPNSNPIFNTKNLQKMIKR